MCEINTNNKDIMLEKAIKLFICTERLHRCVFDRKVSRFNIHRSQHRMLMYLTRRDKPVTQKQLATEFEISSAAVAVACKKLEELGYITRETSVTDNRANNIYVTKKGKELADESRRVFKQIDTAMFSNFTEAELASFMSCLEKIQQNLKNE